MKQTTKLLIAYFLLQIPCTLKAQIKTLANNSDNSQSPISYIFKHRTELNLTPKQIVTLSGQQNKINNLRKTLSTQEFQRTEDAYLRLVLNKDQYRYFLTNYNKNRALSRSVDEWRQLVDFKLNKGLDSAKVVIGFYDFEMGRLSALVESRYAGNTKDSLDILAKFNQSRPFILWKLDAYNERLRSSQFYYAIENRAQLNLYDTQIDSLLTRHIELERKRYDFAKRYKDVPYNSTKFESENIFKILNPSQYLTYLTIKNQPRALLIADNEWQALKKAGLVNKSSDSTKINNENKLYELHVLVARESLSDDKPSAVAIRSSKPLLLKKLEQINSTITANKNLKNSFAW